MIIYNLRNSRENMDLKQKDIAEMFGVSSLAMPKKSFAEHFVFMQCERPFYCFDILREKMNIPTF